MVRPLLGGQPPPWWFLARMASISWLHHLVEYLKSLYKIWLSHWRKCSEGSCNTIVSKDKRWHTSLLNSPHEQRAGWHRCPGSQCFLKKIHKNKCSVHALLFSHNFLTLEVYTGVVGQYFCMLWRCMSALGVFWLI